MRFGSAHVAAALQEMARLHRAVGGDAVPLARLRPRRRGAERLDDDALAALVSRAAGSPAPGIGSALAAMITELYQTGACRRSRSSAGRVPAVALELTRIPRLGLDKIAALHEALGMRRSRSSRPPARRAACGRSRGWARRRSGGSSSDSRASTSPAQRVLLPEALAVAERCAPTCGGAGAATPSYAGDLRRGTETVDELSLVVAPAARGDSMEARLPGAALRQRARARLPGAPRQRSRLELRVSCRAQRYASALLEATGSAAHVQHLASALRPRGAACPRGGERRAEIYRRLGLPFVPPELREDAGEIEAAARGTTCPPTW